MDKPIIARREVTNHILHTFKLKADKRLGQNFLIDEEVVRRIVAAAELSEDDTVLEVGPGIGTLTQGLAQSGARVVAVELDKRLLPVLAKTLQGQSLQHRRRLGVPERRQRLRQRHCGPQQDVGLPLQSRRPRSRREGRSRRCLLRQGAGRGLREQAWPTVDKSWLG